MFSEIGAYCTYSGAETQLLLPQISCEQFSEWDIRTVRGKGMKNSVDRQPSIQRIAVPAIDEILGRKFDVLDDGFVRVIDYLGTDESIVQAARVSYGRGTRPVHEDRGLIRYLMRHHHTTPFEMCEIKFHLRVPMHIWRQWIRHRTANVNEYSTRYSLAIDSMQKTAPRLWRLQDSANRQGSEGVLDDTVGSALSSKERALQELAREVYADRIAQGVAREQARKDLPLSTYTEAYWKIDLWNLFHFLELRLDQGAQQEIRDFAQTIGTQVVSKWVPLAWEAFQDYRLQAVRLSGLEVKILGLLLSGKISEAQEQMRSYGWSELKEGGTQPKKHRERDEFLEKLQKTFGASGSSLRILLGND
jgi:thymidylate synthase (FAD)